MRVQVSHPSVSEMSWLPTDSRLRQRLPRTMVYPCRHQQPLSHRILNHQSKWIESVAHLVIQMQVINRTLLPICTLMEAWGMVWGLQSNPQASLKTPHLTPSQGSRLKGWPSLKLHQSLDMSNHCHPSPMRGMHRSPVTVKHKMYSKLTGNLFLPFRNA